MPILGVDGKPIEKQISFETFALNVRTQFPDVRVLPLQDEAGNRAIGVQVGGQPVASMPLDTSPGTIMQIASITQAAYMAGYYMALGGKPETEPETKGEGD